MRLYNCPQVSQNVDLRNRRDRLRCRMVPLQQVIDSPQQKDGDLIEPRKLTNPVLASHTHRTLHQELLFCYRRGLLPKKKPELQSLLERKQREEHIRRELSLFPPSDLEVQLRSRQHRMQTLEREEEKRRRQSLQNVPEFVRVKGALKHIPGFTL